MPETSDRVFSGIQPSGEIHIGNYLGAVKKWVDLCVDHECYYCVVDDHAITVDYDPLQLPQLTFDAVLATMACGLDPDKCTIFVQSHIPEHTELTWLLNTLTPLGSLFRMTQFKDKARNALQRAMNAKEGGARKSALYHLKNVGLKTIELSGQLQSNIEQLHPEKKTAKDKEPQLVALVASINDMMGGMMQQLQVGLGVAEAGAGLFDYPVLQAADILLYKASLIPVGEDQEQHLELCREVATRFNNKFGDLFPMVSRVKGESAKILGLDGRQKMSKSLGNHIGILDSPETIITKLKPAFTDPSRIRRSDPGHPEICNIFNLHKHFSDKTTIDEISEDCQKGTIGCFDCKTKLAKKMDASLAPIRIKAKLLQNNPKIVIETLDHGRTKASDLAQETMREVRELMGIGSKALEKVMRNSK